MQIIDGRKIRDEILLDLKSRIETLPFAPVFCDVLVGDDSASVQYVNMKNRIAENIGIETHQAIYPESITTGELISKIKEISEIPNITGMIIQLPLPEHIDTKKVLDSIPKEIDVDSISTEATEQFYSNNPIFIYPTASAVMTILDSLDIKLSEKNIVMVGQGMLVGKPVTHLLKNRGISVGVVDSNTENSEEIISKADVLIAAVGKAGIIKGKDLKQDVVVVDAGTSELNGGIAGDVDYEGVENIASAISPVPGGVGPVTVAMLMQNVVLSAERKVII